MIRAIKSITLSATSAALALSGVVEAAERDTTLRALPMHAISFDIGSKHALSYFLANNGSCELTVWLTDTSPDDEGAPGAPTRMLISVTPGKTMQVGSPEGMAAEFVCAANAESISVSRLTEVAYSKPRP
jgi:hypothetical protein